MPLSIRGVLDVSRYYSEGFKELIHKNIAVYDLLLFIICDLIPIGFQFSSLIFGYIRRQNNKKYRLDIQDRRLTESSSRDGSHASKGSMVSGISLDTANYFDPPLLETQSQVRSRSNITEHLKPSQIEAKSQNQGSTPTPKNNAQTNHQTVGAPAVVFEDEGKFNLKRILPGSYKRGLYDKQSIPSSSFQNVIEQHQNLLNHNSSNISSGFKLSCAKTRSPDIERNVLGHSDSESELDDLYSRSSLSE